MHRLSDALAIEMARLAIENIGREYPNAPGHLLRSADDLRGPRELHPAFFGSWDWHSSVHQHWLLVRLLRLERAGGLASDARYALAMRVFEEGILTTLVSLQEKQLVRLDTGAIEVIQEPGRPVRFASVTAELTDAGRARLR